MHTGAGYENASVVEALLNGAEGAWGGLPKGAAMIGHASIGELIANLVRLGNRPRRRSTDGLDQPTVSSPPNHPRAPDTHAPERPMNEASAKNAIDHTVYKTLLESTKAIPWKIDWATTTFAYIGPQIEGLLGWAPSSWVGVQDWVERMHPEDRDRVYEFCVSQSLAGADHEADYRALTKDGGYVWIRDVGTWSATRTAASNR